MSCDIQALQEDEDQPGFAAIARQQLAVYRFPVMVMMSLPNGTMVHSANANDLLDKEQVMALSKHTYVNSRGHCISLTTHWQTPYPMADSGPEDRLIAPCQTQYPMADSVPHGRLSTPCQTQYPMADSVPHGRLSTPWQTQYPMADSVPHARLSTPCPTQYPMADSVPHARLRSPWQTQVPMADSGPQDRLSTP